MLGELAALLIISKVAFRAPEAVGENEIDIVQFAPEATLLPHVLP
jgi:hypothetical protein